jgi:hypothetical protein
MRNATVFLSFILLANTGHADDDVGIGWKLGICAAVTLVAVSGVVGVATEAPLRHAGLGTVITPPLVITATAATGFATASVVAALAARSSAR